MPSARSLAFLLFIASWASNGDAHEDTLFSISSSGTLVDFPEEYGPASIRIQYGSDTDPTRKAEVSVTIGSHTTDLPICFARLFMLPPSAAVRAEGSWYHDFSLLPPYLNIEIPYREHSYGSFDGYSLFFNMKSGELIEVRKHLVAPDGRSQNVAALSETKACEEDLFGTRSKPKR